MLSALVTLGLLLIAFILLLLATLSVPIIKSIFLFKLTAAASSGFLNSSASASVKFGVWGYCTSALDVSVLGHHDTTAGQCSKAHLPYTFDDTVANALHVSGFENLISKALTAVLALHPVAVVLTFIALCVSLFMLRPRHDSVDRSSRVASLLSFISTILAAIFSTIVFLVDVILVAVVRHRVHNETKGTLTLNWGNATWIVLAATILLWIAVIGSMTALCCGNRLKNSRWSSRRRHEIAANEEKF